MLLRGVGGLLHWTLSIVSVGPCLPRMEYTLMAVAREEVRSIPSPNHPSAVADVGSIAAKAIPGLSDDLYPFQLVYDDGVERLGAESARDRVRWVSAIW